MCTCAPCVSVEERLSPVTVQLWFLGPSRPLLKIETPVESDRQHFTSLQTSRNQYHPKWEVWRRPSHLQLLCCKIQGELCTWLHIEADRSHVTRSKGWTPLVAHPHRSKVLSSIFVLVKVSSTPSKKWKTCLCSPSNTKSLLSTATLSLSKGQWLPIKLPVRTCGGSSTSFDKLFSVCSPG